MAQVTGRCFLRLLRTVVPVLGVIALGFAARFSSAAFSSAAEDESLEYGVKATYLLRFAQFVEWPPSGLGPPGSPFNICILGNNPFGNVLDQIVSGEVVQGHSVAIRKIDGEPASGACRVVFVEDREKAARSIERLGREVLTVGEGETFVRNGGMIGFVIENRRVTFDINRKSAEAAGLTLRSGLLSVARSVIK
jgi:hypothetical protein